MFARAFEQQQLHFKLINDGNILFYVEHKELELKNIILSISDDMWEVKVELDSSSPFLKTKGYTELQCMCISISNLIIIIIIIVGSLTLHSCEYSVCGEYSQLVFHLQQPANWIQSGAVSERSEGCSDSDWHLPQVHESMYASLWHDCCWRDAQAVTCMTYIK